MPKLPSQQFLELERIKEGIIILKNGLLRGVLGISSLNFALKSEEEQNAILYRFQDFLNSLDFSIQIIVQSRRFNIAGYLDKLKALEEKQTNELLKIQIREYQQFIKNLVEVGTVMTKHFYLIVPFLPFAPGEVSTYKKLLFKREERAEFTEEEFHRYRIQLWQRMEFVAQGLKRCGLRAIPLNSRELIELFWAIHHPGEAEAGQFPEVPPELGI